MERFTADQARAMMPSKKRISGTEMLLNCSYRRIRGAAIANDNYVFINVDMFLSGAIIDTINALKEDGFDARYDYARNRLIIKW